MKKYVKHIKKQITHKYVFLFVFTLMISTVQAQTVNVGGTVISAADNMPLTGVNILVKGTTKGALTDFDGNYTLDNVPASSTIVFSYLGFKAQEVALNGRTVLNISMEEDTESLDEVVVVGYGSVKKSDLTGSIVSVDTKQMKKFASIDVKQSLQGAAAGVQVTSASGAPGQNSSVRIRGVGSFNNSDPLYVVDGVLTDNIDNISPNDIKSMEVLKDASATAIYGSRGSNGVILITTKGVTVKDDLQVEINAYGGVQQAWNKLDMLNASQYSQLYRESIAVQPTSDLEAWLNEAATGVARGTDWQDEVFRLASVYSVNASVRGNSGAFNYKLGGTFFDQQGIIKNTNQQRKQFNAELQVSPLKGLKVKTGVKYTSNDFVNFRADPYTSPIGTALRKDPINPVRDPITGNYDRTGLTDIGNPALAVELQDNNTISSTRIQPMIEVSYELIKGLTLKSSVVFDETKSTNIDKTEPTTVVTSKIIDPMTGLPQISSNESSTETRLISGVQEIDNIQNTNTISYSKSFGKHSLNTVVGFEAFQSNSSATWTDLTNSDAPFDARAPQVRNYNLLSLLGRVVYSYDDRYLITGSYRRDYSSKFPKGSRGGDFGAVSLGWNVDKESFFPETDIISKLKLRGGYGIIGNQAPIQPYTFLSIMTNESFYSFDNQTASNGWAAVFMPAREISWESSKMANFGIDLTMLSNKLTLTAEYFDKVTEDLLVDTQYAPVPIFAGLQAATTNAASMKNWGTEFSVGYRQSFGDFSFSVNGNISFIRNEVTDIGGGERIDGGIGDGKTQIPATRTLVGEEFASFYGLQSLGIFQTQQEIDSYRAVNSSNMPIDEDGNILTNVGSDYVGTIVSNDPTLNGQSSEQAKIQKRARPGDVKYLDADNDGSITTDDAVNLGSAIPDFTYGLSFSANYKAFDFSFSLAGVQGNEIANVFDYYINGSSAQFNNLTTDRLGRWTPGNPSNSQPRLTSQVTQNDWYSDLYIKDGSYLRVRNVQVGYSPEWKINEDTELDIRFYASVDNLLTITGYNGLDPEIGQGPDPFSIGVDFGNYPQARTFNVGVNIGF